MLQLTELSNKAIKEREKICVLLRLLAQAAQWAVKRF